MRETGFLSRSVTIGSNEHRYVVYVPETYDPALNWPAILFLHGSGESGVDGLRQISVGLGPAVMRSRHEWPFLIVFPQKPEHKALWPSFEPLLDATLRETEWQFSLDRQRLYLTGISQGGHGTFVLATRLRWAFAAIAPVCGFGPPSVVHELSGLPTWGFHGEKDPVIGPERAVEIVGGLREQGGDARMTLYPDLEHNCWDRAYGEERLADWLLRHRRFLDSNR